MLPRPREALVAPLPPPPPLLLPRAPTWLLPQPLPMRTAPHRPRLRCCEELRRSGRARPSKMPSRLGGPAAATPTGRAAAMAITPLAASSASGAAEDVLMGSSTTRTTRAPEQQRRRPLPPAPPAARPPHQQHQHRRRHPLPSRLLAQLALETMLQPPGAARRWRPMLSLGNPCWKANFRLPVWQEHGSKQQQQRGSRPNCAPCHDPCMTDGGQGRGPIPHGRRSTRRAVTASEAPPQRVHPPRRMPPSQSHPGASCSPPRQPPTRSGAKSTSVRAGPSRRRCAPCKAPPASSVPTTPPRRAPALRHMGQPKRCPPPPMSTASSPSSPRAARRGPCRRNRGAGRLAMHRPCPASRHCWCSSCHCAPSASSCA
mmetsp:Transcript_80397/g.208941  ORF Transcript_80397/g.208941 Transcript_80397/m.208941 type:complete len:372 (-) Transcript_80397:1042-2157(-)